MAFPAEGGTREQLSDALFEARRTARSVKQLATTVRDISAVGNIAARRIVLAMDTFQVANDRFNTIKAIPGIAAYAKDQYDDQLFDIAAEFTTMQNALVSTIAWIDANIPKSGQWLDIEEVVSGRITNRMLTSAQTAALRTELDALIATID